ncbi:MAG: hypothetical protein P8Z79_14345, partial [Sedimentisphaerales bacterium]
YMIRGQAYDELGQTRRARHFYDSARIILDTRIDHGSTVAEDFTTRGRIYALSGDTASALRIAGKGYHMLPMARDAIAGAAVAEDYAKVLALTGHPTEAISILDTLLSAPSHLTLVNIKQDAAWDPIRDNPRFQALIEKYEKRYDLKPTI